MNFKIPIDDLILILSQNIVTVSSDIFCDGQGDYRNFKIDFKKIQKSILNLFFYRYTML